MRKIFNDEQKKEILAKALEVGVKQAAKEFGCSEASIQKWKYIKPKKDKKTVVAVDKKVGKHNENFEKEKIIATLEQRLEIISELYSDLVIDYEMLKFYLNKA